MQSPAVLVGGIWSNLKSSLWFLPTLMVSGSILLAIGLVYAGGIVDDQMVQRFPRIFGAGAEGSRGLLTAVASSMITVAGVTFSITIVVLSLASSQYSPRILRNFMSDRFNQVVLGTFLGIYVYCLIVVRTIRSGDDPFVPSIAVLASLLLALIGVGVLIAFIHHIIASIQAEHIIAAAAHETLEVIDELFPGPVGDPLTDQHPKLQRIAEGAAWLPLMAETSGYIQRVDGEGLIDLAERYGGMIRMDRAIGEFCVEGTPLVSINAGAAEAAFTVEAENRRRLLDQIDGDLPDDAAKLKQLTSVANDKFALSRVRTVDQDAGYGIQQIVDIALKALSPGVNETTTAVTCIHHLSSILGKLADRRIETPHRGRDSTLRVIASKPTFGAIVDLSFDGIRRYAAGNLVIFDELFRTIETVAGLVRDPDRLEVLRHQTALTAEQAGRTLDASWERQEMEETIRRVMGTLGSIEAEGWTFDRVPSLAKRSVQTTP